MIGLMVAVQFLFPSSIPLAEARAFSDAHVIEAARQSPGLLSLRCSDGPLMGMRDAPYGFVVVATFDSLDSARSQEAVAGEEKMKALGVVLMMYEVEELPT